MLNFISETGYGVWVIYFDWAFCCHDILLFYACLVCPQNTVCGPPCLKISWMDSAPRCFICNYSPLISCLGPNLSRDIRFRGWIKSTILNLGLSSGWHANLNVTGKTWREHVTELLHGTYGPLHGTYVPLHSTSDRTHLCRDMSLPNIWMERAETTKTPVQQASFRTAANLSFI